MSADVCAGTLPNAKAPPSAEDKKQASEESAAKSFAEGDVLSSCCLTVFLPSCHSILQLYSSHCKWLPCFVERRSRSPPVNPFLGHQS